MADIKYDPLTATECKLKCTSFICSKSIQGKKGGHNKAYYIASEDHIFLMHNSCAVINPTFIVGKEAKIKT